eukprot:TRINITY_DN5696_c0_g1_i6.p1 TRINITY_DN5696_c0_g1~~TRINITY_DN5696_c0_g1_i6.p1  ORF type:complete len:661 (-),score=173.81 TRINITY_DN5696_c0_g1_i6:376-2358(-)
MDRDRDRHKDRHAQKGTKADTSGFFSEGESYMKNVTQMFSDVTSYLPSSLKKQLPVSTSSQFKEEKDQIISASFDSIEIGNELHQCLLLTYTNGWQIWDLHDPDNVHEVISRREKEGPIKCIKALPQPYSEKPGDHFHGRRPVIAVTMAGDAGPNTIVNLFLLKTNEYFSKLKFKTEIYGLLASRHLLVVSLRDHIIAFDSITMKSRFNVDCFSHPVNWAVLALSDRWLAYPSRHPPPASARNHTASDKFVEAANHLATNLIILGQKTVTDYMYPNEGNKMISTSPTASMITGPSSSDGAGGSIVIHDVKENKEITIFQAHGQPLSVMTFDATGSILVTSSLSGTHFKVFQIGIGIPPAGSTGPVSTGTIRLKQLYDLQRGMTNATIQDIKISADTRWVAVSSTRGTTHMFAINPLGGPVTIDTHLRSATQKPSLFPLLPADAPPISLNSVQRIRQTSTDDSNTTVVISAFVAGTIPSEKMFSVSYSGNLTQYQLGPHAGPPTDTADPPPLNLDCKALIEWDVSRRSKWHEVPAEISEKEVPMMKPVGNWLSNVEISTHTPLLRPLWASPQFTFKTLQVEKMRKDVPHYLFYESTPSDPLKLSHDDPIPFRENSESQIIQPNHFSDNPKNSGISEASMKGDNFFQVTEKGNYSSYKKMKS